MPPVAAALAAITLEQIITYFVVSLITSVVMGAITKSLAKKPSGGASFQAEGRLITVRQAINSHQFIIGRCRHGGAITFFEVSSDNDYLHLVITLAGHTLESIDDIYFNDDLVVFSGGAAVGKYAGYANMETSLGDEGAAQPFPSLVAESSGKWTDAHLQRGRAKIHLRLKHNVDLYPTGVPNITVVSKGNAEILDPRESPAYTGWSNNPALVLAYYLANINSGLALDYDTEINEAALIAAANVCDERVLRDTGDEATFTISDGKLALASGEKLLLTGDGVRVDSSGALPTGLSAGVTYYAIASPSNLFALAATAQDAQKGIAITISDGGSGTHTLTYYDEPRYRVDGTYSTNEKPSAIIQRLLGAMAGSLVNVDGQWMIYAGAYDVPTVSLNEDDFAGPIRIQTNVSKRDNANRVKGLFTDPSSAWQPVDFPPVVSATYLAEDGGEEIWRDVDLTPFVMSGYQAQRLAKIELLRTRQGLTVTGKLRLSALRLVPSRTVYLSNEKFGWVNKPFQVIGLGFTADEDGAMLVEASLRETAAEIYDWSTAEENYVSIAPNTNLPSLFGGLTVSGLQSQTGGAWLLTHEDGTQTPRIRLNWTAVQSSFASYYEVQYAKSSQSPMEWADAPDVLAAANPVSFLSVVVAGESYDVRVRAVTMFENAGEWTYLDGITVVGKEAVPSNVSDMTSAFEANGVVLSWPAVADKDIDYYELREGSVWETSLLVARVKATWYRLAAFSEEKTFLLKAVDTSGNESSANESVTVSPVAPGAVSSLAAAIVGRNMALSWSAPSSGSYNTERYEIRFGQEWEGSPDGSEFVSFSDLTQFVRAIDWSESRTWWVAPVDASGATGTPTSVELVVTAPNAPVVSAQSIDNNVLLSWTSGEASLPISHYEVRVGETFESAEITGIVDAQFSVFFESVAGVFRYWVVGVDTAGNYGTPGSVSVTVSAPPDYVLYSDFDSALDGTLNNGVTKADGTLLFNVNATETYQDHFINNSWSTPQDQINAGYPIFIQPNELTGSYIETIDYGTTIPATLITITLGKTDVDTQMNITPIIRWKAEASPTGDEWNERVGSWQTYATAFRYVQIELDFSGASSPADLTELVQIDTLNIRLDTKKLYDSGVVTANSGDSGGTTVTFNKAFIDIESITLTPESTDAVFAVLSFTDAPNPTDFQVLVFNTAGSRVTRDVRWAADGF